MKVAKILRWYDKDGKYIGPKDRMVRMKEGSYPLEQYADMHGIKLPDAKEKKEHKPKKEVNSYADMEQSHHQGHTEEYGDGDSKSKE